MPKWAVVLDFDGTLISKEYTSLYNVVDQAILDPEYARRVAELRNKYMKIVADRALTVTEQKDWFFRTIQLYVEFGLTMDKVKEAMARVKLREGVKECLELLKERGVLVAIVSYGIRQFINTVLESNGASHLVSKVYSGDLTIDENSGMITGCRRETVVLPRDKGMVARKFAALYKVPRKNILGVGDSRHDAELGEKKENRFGIADDKRSKAILEIAMGTVVLTNDFYPVIEWLHDKLGLYKEVIVKDKNEEFCCHPFCGEDKLCPECDNFMPRPYKTGN